MKPKYSKPPVTFEKIPAGGMPEPLSKFGMKVNPLIVVCMTDEIAPQSRGIWLCPVGKI